MSLKTYQQRRKFLDTPEPKPKKRATVAKKLIFVIHKHSASHLHYDLRLELDGILKSWALPKGLPQGHEKHLAIMTEDHPFDYKDFHGVIPKGHYGAGLVEIWDHGTYFTEDFKKKQDIEAYMKKALKKGHIRFHLLGKRIDAEYSLVKTDFQGLKNSWLLLKHDPENKAIKPDAFIKNPKAMLAKIADKPFNDKNWLFEIKFDGYRALAKIHNGKVELISRNDISFNSLFPNILEDLKKHIKKDAILDGEIVKTDQSGRVDFKLLQDKGNKQDAIFYVFDLLYLDGQDLRGLPLLERKEKLELLLTPLKKTNIKYSDHIMEKGVKLFNEIEKLGLEGIMAKKADSPYVGHRSSDWLKIKVANLEQVVIGGFTASKGGSLFGALLLGQKTSEGLKYIGKVGTGFSGVFMEDIYKKLKPRIRKTNPFYNLPKKSEATFVKPELWAEVSFSEWTNKEMLRHPVFKRLLDEKRVKL